MTLPSPALAKSVASTQKPFGFRAARLAVLFVAVLNLIWAVFGVRAVTAVRSGHGLEFGWGVVAYPAAFGTLAALAMWWLRQERTAGAVLGSLLVLFHGVRRLLDAASGEGYPSDTSRVAGQVFEGTIGMFLVGCAISLAVAGRMFHRSRKMTPAGS